MITLAILTGAKPQKGKICGPVRIPKGKWAMDTEHHVDSLLVLRLHHPNHPGQFLVLYEIDPNKKLEIESNGEAYSVIFEEAGTEKFINILARKIE